MAEFTPAYLQLSMRELRERAERAREELRSCTACPRNCRVNRWEDETGVCKVGRFAKVASYFPHTGEEDCLRGSRGSGTIFFSFCNLRCVFCQNFDVSWEGEGGEVTPERLAEMMLELQKQGCHNINWVTPEHVVPQVLEAMPLAVEKGLRLPIVYNTSAYDSLESLRLLEGIVDIYMPDLKTLDREVARKYLGAKDYPEVAKAAIKEMHRQVGDLVIGEDGLARRGLLVRHLVMPNDFSTSEAVMKFLAEEISKDTYVNIMAQYYPAGKVVKNPKYKELDRCIHFREWEKAVEAAEKAGLHRLDPRRPRIWLL